MTVRTKSSAVLDQWARTVTFTATTDFAQDDILNFLGSLSGAAGRIVITTGAGSSITFTQNDRVIRYPMNPTGDTLQGTPDLSDPREFRDTNAATQTVGASTTATFTGPFKEIRITALTAGAGITVSGFLV